MKGKGISKLDSLKFLYTTFACEEILQNTMCDNGKTVMLTEKKATAVRNKVF
jgi:hypothetical protein